MFLNLLNNYVMLDQKEKKTRIAMRSNGPQKQVRIEEVTLIFPSVFHQFSMAFVFCLSTACIIFHDGLGHSEAIKDF
jgi:hypothetical protein